GYKLKNKDSKSGVFTYTKQNSYYTFTVNLKFKGESLKMISWNDIINRGQFIVNDIGNDICYTIDEVKTNDSVGIFTSKCLEKQLEVTIYRTQPNIKKGMISFTIMKITNK
ncbi:hypothetical protein BWK59_13625, partial [Flavobacterium davisii]